jgi:hypothetical protein
MKRWMLTVLSSSLITAISLAQPGSYSPFPGEPCSCPETEDPVSDDYAAIQVENGVLGAVLGLEGTVTWFTGCFPLENTTLYHSSCRG